jgi:hypothetical protein
VDTHEAGHGGLADAAFLVGEGYDVWTHSTSEIQFCLTITEGSGSF